MDEYESLSHTRWDCKYHVVFIPKCRRRAVYGELRRARQRQSRDQKSAPDLNMFCSAAPARGCSGGAFCFSARP